MDNQSERPKTVEESPNGWMIFPAVALPWGTLTWDGRLYTSHPPHYTSNHRIEGSELGDVIARTGVALQKHRDEVSAKLAALAKSILDGLKL